LGHFRPLLLPTYSLLGRSLFFLPTTLLGPPSCSPHDAPLSQPNSSVSTSSHPHRWPAPACSLSREVWISSSFLLSLIGGIGTTPITLVSYLRPGTAGHVHHVIVLPLPPLLVKCVGPDLFHHFHLHLIFLKKSTPIDLPFAKITAPIRRHLPPLPSLPTISSSH
jgi:hypothetical protein